MKNKTKVAILTAFIVTSYISFTLVMINIGFVKNLFLIWLKNWMIAFLLAIPSLLFIAPYIKKRIENKL